MQMAFVWWPSARRYDTASRMEPITELTDEQWSAIEDLFPWSAPTRAGGRPCVPPEALLRRDLVDPLVGSPMERFTKIVSLIRYLLAKITNVGEGRHLPESLRAVLARARRT